MLDVKQSISKLPENSTWYTYDSNIPSDATALLNLRTLLFLLSAFCSGHIDILRDSLLCMTSLVEYHAALEDLKKIISWRIIGTRMRFEHESAAASKASFLLQCQLISVSVRGRITYRYPRVCMIGQPRRAKML